MGKKPTAKKKLEGTYREDRAPKNEMQPNKVTDVEKPTALLNEFAETEWLKVTGVLSDLGMLYETDTSILLAYCNEIGKYFQSCQILKEKGFVFETPKGFMQARPEVKLANDSLQHATKLSDKFGFNPAARTKIEMPKQNKKNGLDDF